MSIRPNRFGNLRLALDRIGDVCPEGTRRATGFVDRRDGGFRAGAVAVGTHERCTLDGKSLRHCATQSTTCAGNKCDFTL
jgi:hypothetical protein